MVVVMLGEMALVMGLATTPETDSAIGSATIARTCE
jgi:hypothetical protein